jgi:hypothetical protein
VVVAAKKPATIDQYSTELASILSFQAPSAYDVTTYLSVKQQPTLKQTTLDLVAKGPFITLVGLLLCWTILLFAE